jgi:hypothetical protein
MPYNLHLLLLATEISYLCSKICVVNSIYFIMPFETCYNYIITRANDHAIAAPVACLQPEIWQTRNLPLVQ